MSTNGPDLTVYNGNCHCANVRYTVAVPSLYSKPVVQCNCAVCTKHGLLMTHCPRKALVFTRGFEKLSKYYTGQKSRTFRFCSGCGTPLCFDVEDPDKEGAGDEFVGLNVRTIDGIQVDQLEVVKHDGKAQGEPYVIAP